MKLRALGALISLPYGAAFYVGRKHTTTNFSSFPKIRMYPKIQLQESRCPFDILRDLE